MMRAGKDGRDGAVRAHEWDTRDYRFEQYEKAVRLGRQMFAFTFLWGVVLGASMLWIGLNYGP